MSTSDFIRKWFPPNCSPDKVHLLETEKEAEYCSRHNFGFYFMTALAIVLIIVLLAIQNYIGAGVVAAIYGVYFFIQPYFDVNNFVQAKAEIDGYMKNGMTKDQAGQEYIKHQNNLQLVSSARPSQPGLGTGLGVGFGAALGNAAGNVLTNAMFGQRRQ